VLKCCSDTYNLFSETKPFIKLKKGYIPGLRDTADFVVVGGRRDVRDEQELGIGKLWWTSLYIGCLESKDEVCCFDAKPRFRIVDMINWHRISKGDMTYLNCHGYFERVPFAKSMQEFDVVIEYGRKHQLVDLFKRPFIV
jgi:DNA ligase 4